MLLWAATALVWVAGLEAAPTNERQAERVVKGWLRSEPQPLAVPLGQAVQRVETYVGPSGPPAYFVVYLNPAGFVVVSADDQVEPIVAFAAEGVFDPSPANPLGALVSGDLPARVARAQVRPQGQARQARANGKWRRLEQISTDSADTPLEASVAGVPDVRVAPLLASRWAQGSLYGDYLYNYYTPNHYVAGCVATATAQLMRFHQYPTDPIGVRTFSISVGGVRQDASTCGGDGFGGAYVWSQMPLVPTSTILPVQRQAIGALCYDAGVAVSMAYNTTANGGSGADTLLVCDALVNVFGYANAVKGFSAGQDIGEGLRGMINPNLHADHPVLLGIRGAGGGHAIVADGYGYSGSTLYYHLNMGWSGAQDAWYNLPNIDSSPSFDSVYKCIYNVFVAGRGEIIAGRVVDEAGAPLAGVAVRATDNLGTTYTDTTSASGVYGILAVPSNTTFTVTATLAGYPSAEQTVTTGASVDYNAVSGNVNDADFVLRQAPPRKPGDVDGDDFVSVLDVISTVDAFGSQPGDDNWDDRCDFDANQKVDVGDLIITVTALGS